MLDLPIWIWPVALLVVLVIAFSFTKNLYRTCVLGFAFSAVIALCALLSWWHGYLQDHIIAQFNDAGMPVGFSRSGLWLLVDAWPVWLIPIILCIIICEIIFRSRRTTVIKTNTIVHEIAVPESIHSTSASVSDKLAIEHLKHELKVAEEKQRLLKGQVAPGGQQVDRYVKELRTARRELHDLQHKYETLNQKFDNSEAALKRANQTIEDLLSKKKS